MTKRSSGCPSADARGIRPTATIYALQNIGAERCGEKKEKGSAVQQIMQLLLPNPLAALQVISEVSEKVSQIQNGELARRWARKRVQNVGGD